MALVIGHRLRSGRDSGPFDHLGTLCVLLRMLFQPVLEGQTGQWEHWISSGCELGDEATSSARSGCDWSTEEGLWHTPYSAGGRGRGFGGKWVPVQKRHANIASRRRKRRRRREVDGQARRCQHGRRDGRQARRCRQRMKYGRLANLRHSCT